MAKLSRVSQRTFGLGGPTGNFGQFGSLAANAKVTSKDPATIQALQAWLNGLASAIVQVGNEPGVPALEDINGVLLVAFYQLAYLFQAGIAEWDSGTTYFKNSFSQVNGTVYMSKTDNNLNNNPTTDSVNWVSSPNSAPVGSLYGGVPSNNSIDPTFRLDFSACQAKDDSGAYIITVPAITKSVASAWAAGSGQGGMDTGTIGSSPCWVYTYAIGDKNGVQPADILFSKSSTSPVMPTGYNLKRLVGSRKWTGTNFRQFTTHGSGISRSVFYKDEPQAVLNGVGGTSSAFVDVSAASEVPAATSRLAMMSATLGGDPNGTNSQLDTRVKGSSAVGSYSTVKAGLAIGYTLGRSLCVTFDQELDSDGTFQYRFTNANLYVFVSGFYEEL